MSGKGKAKLKSPQKHLSKTSVKNEAHSITITEMFKKQNERKTRQSEDKSCADIEDEDDVIFVEEIAGSPYFSKPVPSVTIKAAQNTSGWASASTVLQTVKKRKLSLSRIDSIFNCESVSEQSDNQILCVDRENQKKNNTFDNTVNRSASDKLDESEHSVPLTTDFELRQQKFVKNKFKEPKVFNEILKSDAMSLKSGSTLSSSPGIKCHSSDKIDLDISYSPVFPKHADLTQVISTLINDKTSICKTDSVQPESDISSIQQTSDKFQETPASDDTDSMNGVDNSANESTFEVPYYLSSFETLMQTVMEDETNRKLFNDDDMHIITSYQKLSAAAKKLYIRIFSRKLNWIPLNKLNYPEISDDLKPQLQELKEAAFIDCDEHLTDLEEVLTALTASDIKTLAKSYHITSNISQKKLLVQELLKKSQQSTLTTMFGYAGGYVARAMLTRAKGYLNGIYRLKIVPRGVFVRVMMLFSLSNTLGDEDSRTGGQGQLFQMLMVNLGKLVYPAYTIEKVHSVFQDREALIRFENALQLESDLLYCMERGNWDKAYTVFQSIEKKWTLLATDESIEKWNKSLPDFLRCYTASSVIHGLLSASVEILQRRKDYTGAIELLHKLLSETTYNCSHRGYWWERLALNLDAHMKQPLESLEAVQNGLADSHVRVGHRLALYLRAESICQRTKSKLQNRLKEFHHEVVRDTPKVYIEGRVLHQGVSTNGTRFLTEKSYVDGNTQDMVVVGVEEFVLDYYKRNGFPSGIHAEGSIVSTLFVLFFWDIMFMSVPDAFHSPFQSMPLDMHSHMFYDRRKHDIEERLAKLKASSIQELHTQAEETWTSQQGVLCAGINWDRISLDCIKELLSCLGGEVLSGIIGRYARCPRHTRSGFPDLTLWNAETGALKICEVKGPGDRLSHKQILWIDYLVTLGVDAEVCHVKAVAAKKLKPSQQ